ncbi:MAG TPA: hypothetical protein PLV85_06040, partial [Polyangiaceae bacterium]|nr:hypothetical protein [Polyangiaceae bacterium]
MPSPVVPVGATPMAPAQPVARPTPAPVQSASAKAPPPPVPAKPPDPMDDDDFDEAPTAMFVHSVKYKYDPDAPPEPGSPGLLDDDDDDEYEPPTAIHVSP